MARRPVKGKVGIVMFAGGRSHFHLDLTQMVDAFFKLNRNGSFKGRALQIYGVGAIFVRHRTAIRDNDLRACRNTGELDLRQLFGVMIAGQIDIYIQRDLLNLGLHHSGGGARVRLDAAIAENDTVDLV